VSGAGHPGEDQDRGGGSDEAVSRSRTALSKWASMAAMAAPTFRLSMALATAK